MALNNFLKRENNNLDVFRIIAALAVIYGHAYVLAPQTGKEDFFPTLFSVSESIDGFAVKVFFFLSGLVVTNSLLIKQNSLQFIIARCFRIWPALIATVIITALFIAPIISNSSITDYFFNSQAYRYIYHNIKLSTDFQLPGVFIDNSYKNSVNGSLWTIPYEVSAYLVLLALFTLKKFNSKIFDLKVLSITVLILSFLDTICATKVFSEHSSMFFCFCLGSVLAVYQKNLTINYQSVLISWILYYFFRGMYYSVLLLYVACFITILYISSIKFVVQKKLKFDISYGIYLWGFPVQQIMSKYFLDYGVRFNQISTMFIACILGYISWHLIEKRAIKKGQEIAYLLATNKTNFKN